MLPSQNGHTSDEPEATGPKPETLGAVTSGEAWQATLKVYSFIQ